MKAPSLATLSLLLIHSSQALTYSVTDLGTLGSFSYGDAISSSGLIAGRTNIAAGASETQAFRRVNGTLVNLGTLGGPNSYARGIADDGTVTGYGTNTGEAATRAFIALPNLAMSDIGTLGGTDSYAYGINNNLAIVGKSKVTGNTYTHAYVYILGSGMTDLGTLAGANADSEAAAINDKGQIVGNSKITGGATHAFLHANNVMSDLGTLGGTNSYARAISSNGIIAGYSETSGGKTRAFLYDRATMLDLGGLGGNTSVANGVNADGFVVGSSYLADNSTLHAMIYRDGTLQDLNDLLPGNSGWELADALAINDKGQITGWGYFNGQIRGFLLEESATSAPPAAQAPRVYVNGALRITTGKSKQKLTGSSGGDVRQVLYRLNGKGAWKKTRGNVSGWKVSVALKPGKNFVHFVAVSPADVRSRPVKVVITRTSN